MDFPPFVSLKERNFHYMLIIVAFFFETPSREPSTIRSLDHRWSCSQIGSISIKDFGSCLFGFKSRLQLRLH